MIKTYRKIMRLSLLVLSVMFLAAICTQSVQAGPMLRLSDGTDTVTIMDNGGDDDNALLGIVEFSPSISPFDSFFVSVAVGSTKPALGTADSPQVDLFSVNISGGAGQLTIEFTDTEFTGPDPGIGGYESAIGGITDGSVLFNSYYDNSNAVFGTANNLASLGPFSGGAFSDSSWTDLSALSPLPAGPYSLTLVTTVTHTSSGQATSFNAHVTVPEPSTLLLLGAGLLGLGYFGMKRDKKKETLSNAKSRQ